MIHKSKSLKKTSSVRMSATPYFSWLSAMDRHGVFRAVQVEHSKGFSQLKQVSCCLRPLWSITVNPVLVKNLY